MNQDKLHSKLIDALGLVNEDPAKAQLIAERALLRSQRNGWVASIALSHLVIACSGVKRDSAKFALDEYYKALTLFRDLNDSTFIAQCYFGLGRAYSKIGQYSLALEQYRKALSTDLYEAKSIHLDIHLALSNTLMNIGQWSDAEQELLSLPQQDNLSDQQLIKYQLQVLRLAFYRGDQRTIKDQLKFCSQLLAGIESQSNQLVLLFYHARYETKFGKFKQGLAHLTDMWNAGHGQKFFFLNYEAGQDLLRSDYPKSGITALNRLLELDNIPEVLRLKIHQLLAHFYADHLSFELATAHHQAAEKVAEQVRKSEINEQWARFQVEEQQQSLREQVEIEKHNNSVLAESNAMLQAVNRIALAVNASLDFESLARQLRTQLEGWINASVIAVAEAKEDTLEFKCIIEGEKSFGQEVLPLSENRSWSVRAVNEGRILYDNDFVLKDELLMTNTPNLVRSVAFVPLKFENKVIGLLSLQSTQAQVFDVKAVSLLEYIAPVVGIAFANLVHLHRSVELTGEVSRQREELQDVRDLVAHLSDHDELTGLPNRHSLNGHFKRWQHFGRFHCLMVSISNLSDLASSLGYGTDDEVVKVISKRLNNRLRPDDLLVRSTNEQFVLLVESMKNDEVLLELANQLKLLCEQPLRAKDQTINAKIAIGLVSYPEHGETLEELMSMASVALSHANEASDGLFSVG